MPHAAFYISSLLPWRWSVASFTLTAAKKKKQRKLFLFSRSRVLYEEKRRLLPAAACYTATGSTSSKLLTFFLFCLVFFLLGSAHIHAHSSCCSCSKAQARTHTYTHNINRRFALFLLPMWLFITTGRQPLFEKSCRQQEYRLLERKEEESLIRARMTRRMWLLSLTNQLDRSVETRVESDVLHHDAVFLELVMLRPAGAGSKTFFRHVNIVERHKSPQTAPAM